MTRRTHTVRRGTLFVFALLALTACGTTDPPVAAPGDPVTSAELRLPRSLDLAIEPAGTHPLLPTEGFGKTVALDGARVAVADYLDWQFQGLRYPHVDTFALVNGVAVFTGKVPEVGYGELCFGKSLAVIGDLLVVGEPCANGGSGEVHLFVRSRGAWVEEPALAPVTGTGVERFGDAIAVAANRIVIGAPGEAAIDPDGTVRPGVGAIYVYSLAGGEVRFDARLVPADAATNDSFGWAVSMDAATIAATSPGRWNGDAAGTPLGANGKAYLFRLTSTEGWVEAESFVVGDGVAGEWTGQTVALCSGTLFVGSETWTWPAVHAFQSTVTGWVEGDLEDPAPPANGHVDNLACDGAVLAVGMPYAGPPEAVWIGTARVYAKMGGAWGLVGEIAGSLPGDRAGHATAVDGSVIAAGIPSAAVNSRALGIVRVKRF